MEQKNNRTETLTVRLSLSEKSKFKNFCSKARLKQGTVARKLIFQSLSDDND